MDDVQETAKVDEDKDITKFKSLMEVIPDEEEVAIDAIPLATKPLLLLTGRFTKKERKAIIKPNSPNLEVKLGFIILEEEESKLEIIVAMMEEEVPYLEEVGGSLAICSIELKEGLGGGGLVIVGGRSSSVSKRAWGEVRGVENKSSMGSMLIAKGEECLDGWVGSDLIIGFATTGVLWEQVRAGGGEVKGGGVDFGVTKSLLGEIPGESGGEEF
ncbi:hypothetical protein Tco_0885461 [Tanacetum coccineum]